MHAYRPDTTHGLNAYFYATPKILRTKRRQRVNWLVLKAAWRLRDRYGEREAHERTVARVVSLCRDEERSGGGRSPWGSLRYAVLCRVMGTLRSWNDLPPEGLSGYDAHGDWPKL